VGRTSGLPVSGGSAAGWSFYIFKEANVSKIMVACD
jgi:hypothetical protein